jgi:hypothetical protein
LNEIRKRLGHKEVPWGNVRVQREGMKLVPITGGQEGAEGEEEQDEESEDGR